MYKLKINFDGETHRLRITPTEFGDLVKAIATHFKPKSISGASLKYEDPDEKLVEIASHNDYKLMVENDKKMKVRERIIYVIGPKKQSSKDSKAFPNTEIKSEQEKDSSSEESDEEESEEEDKHNKKENNKEDMKKEAKTSKKKTEKSSDESEETEDEKSEEEEEENDENGSRDKKQKDDKRMSKKNETKEDSKNDIKDSKKMAEKQKSNLNEDDFYEDKQQGRQQFTNRNKVRNPVSESMKQKNDLIMSKIKEQCMEIFDQEMSQIIQPLLDDFAGIKNIFQLFQKEVRELKSFIKKQDDSNKNLESSLMKVIAEYSNFQKILEEKLIKKEEEDRQGSQLPKAKKNKKGDDVKDRSVSPKKKSREEYKERKRNDQKHHSRSRNEIPSSTESLERSKGNRNNKDRSESSKEKQKPKYGEKKKNYKRDSSESPEKSVGRIFNKGKNLNELARSRVSNGKKEENKKHHSRSRNEIHSSTESLERSKGNRNNKDRSESSEEKQKPKYEEKKKNYKGDSSKSPEKSVSRIFNKGKNLNDSTRSRVSNGKKEENHKSDYSQYNVTLTEELKPMPALIYPDTKNVHLPIKLKNTGSIKWPKKCILKHHKGPKGQNVEIDKIPSPGEEITTMILLQGPFPSGRIKSGWKIVSKDEDGDDLLVGAPFYVSFDVEHDKDPASKKMDERPFEDSDDQLRSPPIKSKSSMNQKVENDVSKKLDQILQLIPKAKKDKDEIEQFINDNPNMKTDTIIDRLDLLSKYA